MFTSTPRSGQAQWSSGRPPRWRSAGPATDTPTRGSEIRPLRQRRGHHARQRRRPRPRERMPVGQSGRVRRRRGVCARARPGDADPGLPPGCGPAMARACRAANDRRGADVRLRHARCDDGRWLVAGAPEWDYRPQDASRGDIVGTGRVFVYDLETLDSDGDTMPDTWEQQLRAGPQRPGRRGARLGRRRPHQRAGARRVSHPRNDPAFTRYFAEGATSDFFETRFSIANPGDAERPWRCGSSTPTGDVAGTTLTVPARASRKVVVNDVAGMSRAEFSTTLESDHLVVADRLMTWSRAERLRLPRRDGHRRSLADLVSRRRRDAQRVRPVLPDPEPERRPTPSVRVTYLRPNVPPLKKTYTVGPRSRFTIWVDYEQFPGRRAASAVARRTPMSRRRSSRSTARRSSSSAPCTTGRRRRARGPVVRGGARRAGVSAPARDVVLRRRGDGGLLRPVLPRGEPERHAGHPDRDIPAARRHDLTKTYTAAPKSRSTIWVDHESFPGVAGAPLSTRRPCRRPSRYQGAHPGVVVERAMWWPGPGATTWTEAHDSAGATTTAPRWVAAEGRGERRAAHRHLLLDREPVDDETPRCA